MRRSARAAGRVNVLARVQVWPGASGESRWATRSWRGMENASNLDLSLWKQGLGAVPAHVWDRTELRTLVLADNGLTEISERVGELRALRMLDLGHNLLRRIPDSLSEFTDLSDFLYLHDNALTELPASLDRLA